MIIIALKLNICTYGREGAVLYAGVCMFDPRVITKHGCNERRLQEKNNLEQFIVQDALSDKTSCFGARSPAFQISCLTSVPFYHRR